MKHKIGSSYKTVGGLGDCIGYSSKNQLYRFYFPFEEIDNMFQFLSEDEVLELIEDLPTYKYLYDYWAKENK